MKRSSVCNNQDNHDTAHYLCLGRRGNDAEADDDNGNENPTAQNDVGLMSMSMGHGAIQKAGRLSRTILSE